MARKKRDVEVPAEPAPQQPVPARPRATFTAEETRQQLQAVEGLLVRPDVTSHQMARAMRERFGVGATRLAKLVARVKERWAREDAENRPSNKAQQVRRIYGYIRDAAGVRNDNGTGWKVPPNHHALARWESILADLLGTREPVQVTVDVAVSQSLVHVIAGLTPEQVDGYLERHRETEALAEAYRRMLPALPTGDKDRR